MNFTELLTRIAIEILKTWRMVR